MPLALPQPDYSYVTLCRQTEEVRSHCFNTGAPASAIVWSNVHDYPGTCFSRQTVYGPVNVRVKPGGQGHFACMYRLFCLISTTYVYYMHAYLHIDICINQSDKTTASTVLRVYCCGLAANFYLFKSNWQRTTAAHFGDTVAHRQTHTHTDKSAHTCYRQHQKKKKMALTLTCQLAIRVILICSLGTCFFNDAPIRDEMVRKGMNKIFVR